MTTTLPPTHTYTQYIPTPCSQRFIEAFWTVSASVPTLLRILPDGCNDLIIHYSAHAPKVTLVGPMTRPDKSWAKPGEYFVGIRLQPGVLLRQSCTNLSQVRDQHILASEGVSRDLLALLYRPNFSEGNLLDSLEHWAQTQARQDQWISDSAVDDALCRIQENPLLPVQSLYHDFPLSSRALERRFLKMVGITPKFYARVLRQQLAARRLSESVVSMAGLAQDLGYADQAHFIRDFKALAGLTPDRFRAERLH